MKCTYCGAETPDTARFCCDCGREIYSGELRPEIKEAPAPGTKPAEIASPVYTDFGGAISLYFRNYINFTGRSTRSEYWFAFLFTGVIRFILSLFDTDSAITMFDLWVLAIFLPDLAIACRRLHDIGRSAAGYIGFQFMTLIVVIGLAFGAELQSGLVLLFFFAALLVCVGICIYYIVLFCQPSQSEANEYGRAPY